MVERLERFKLSEKEEMRVELSLSDIKNSRDSCTENLVGRDHRKNVVNFTGLKKIMTKL